MSRLTSWKISRVPGREIRPGTRHTDATRVFETQRS
jgi:hypothetical protein